MNDVAAQPSSNESHQSTRNSELSGTVHDLKTDPEVFDAVARGAKTFEIRFDDRGFKVGDTLRLRETRATGAQMRAGLAPLIYTGREEFRHVSHVLTGYGLTDGWCCLSFASPGGTGRPIRSPQNTQLSDEQIFKLSNCGCR